MKLKIGKCYETNMLPIEFADYFSKIKIYAHSFVDSYLFKIYRKDFLVLQNLTPTETSSVHSYKVLIDGNIKLLQFTYDSNLFETLKTYTERMEIE